MEVVPRKAYLTWQPSDRRPLYAELIGEQVQVGLQSDPSLIEGRLVAVDHLLNHSETPGAMGKIILQISKGLVIVRAPVILAIGEE